MIAKYYRYFRWLSLDIVLGAIVFLAFLEKLYNQHIPWPVYWALGSAIWLIYTADHLIDSRKSNQSARRAFHYRHFNILVLLGGVVLIAAILSLPLLPSGVLKNGALLSACCVVYLMMVYFIRGLWVKEVMVAAGYALGIFLAPVSALESITVLDVILVIQLGVIALINLMVFSYFDFEEDQDQGFSSLPSRLGKRYTVVLINVLIVLSFGLISVSINMGLGENPIQLSYAIMTALLALVFWRPSYFQVEERFRVIGDAVFFVPLIFLW